MFGGMTPASVTTLLSRLKMYFIKWWMPLVGFGFLCVWSFVGLLLKRDWIIDSFLIGVGLNTLGTLASCVVQVFIRKWYFIFLQLGVMIPLLMFIFTVFMYSAPDFYGSHKVIPSGINISVPLEQIPSLTDRNESVLTVAQTGQPGMYSYYTSFQPKQDGYLYIKAFEITSNDRLSKESIKKKSKVRIKKGDSVNFSGDFTIYEGTWGDKYAGRIELWFQPSGGENEFKIIEKNYIVEGWMR
jgi:hypothetical protein